MADAGRQEDAAPFPLPLTVFEQYMLLDDWQEHPMTAFLSVRLLGRPCRPAFEAALEDALARHPLLWALVDPDSAGGPSWRSAGGLRPQVDWNSDRVPVVCPRGGRIDLAVEPGLRVWVREGDTSVKVMLQFHHACCDGIGVYQFLGDLLAGYGMRTAPKGFVRCHHPRTRTCSPGGGSGRRGPPHR